jgi:hypothetical protein
MRTRTNRRRKVTPVEAIAVIAVIVAIIAMGVWFFLLSSGGIGPGSV